MPKLHVTDRHGEERTLESAGGKSVMQVIRESGFGDIAAVCAGVCSCSTCHIYVDPAFADRLPPMSGDEDDLLEITGTRTENSRLACQVKFADDLDGLAVTVAPED